MRTWAHAIVVLLLAIGLTFAPAVLVAYMPLSQIEGTQFIVEVAPNPSEGLPDGGTIHIFSADNGPDQYSKWPAFLEFVGCWRTDLFLDPGPYSVAQRRRAHPSSPWSGTTPLRMIANGATISFSRESPSPEFDEPTPRWIRAVAVEHAGPGLNGWQARVAGMGWPRPILYWLWDFRTDSMSGGMLPIGEPAAQRSLPQLRVPKHAVAYRVLWPEALTSIGALCAGYLVLLVSKVAVQRQWRKFKGRCSKCGYDLKNQQSVTVCPECGKATRGTSQTVLQTVKPLESATAER